MNIPSKTLIPAVLLLALSGALPAHARGHKSKPLAFEELPPVCQKYFKRAEACYAKAGEKASLYHAGNTQMLYQSLPAATPEQRTEMCTIAAESFADKAKALKCE